MVFGRPQILGFWSLEWAILFSAANTDCVHVYAMIQFSFVPCFLTLQLPKSIVFISFLPFFSFLSFFESGQNGTVLIWFCCTIFFSVMLFDFTPTLSNSSTHFLKFILLLSTVSGQRGCLCIIIIIIYHSFFFHAFYHKYVSTFFSLNFSTILSSLTFFDI